MHNLVISGFIDEMEKRASLGGIYRGVKRLGGQLLKGNWAGARQTGRVTGNIIKKDIKNLPSTIQGGFKSFRKSPSATGRNMMAGAKKFVRANPMGTTVGALATGGVLGNITSSNRG